MAKKKEKKESKKKEQKEQKEEKNIKKEQKDFDSTLNEINKQYGAGTIVKLSDIPTINVDAIPTGALSLDLAIGVGGVPRGRIVEIFGPESSGKSTLCLSIIKNCQKLNGKVVYIDAENAMDANYAEAIGVDVKSLGIVQPDSGEQALDIIEKFVKANVVDLIVVDSLAALVPKEELEGHIGDRKMAPQARMMSTALRRLTGVIGKSKACVIFINQVRDAVGAYSPNKNYKPISTPGGRALKFYASVRIEVRIKEQIEGSDGSKIGNVVKAKIVKNKVGIPFKEAFFEIIFGKGIKKISAIFSAAEQVGAIEKIGNKYMFDGKQLGLGRDKAFKALKEDKELLAKVELKAREMNLKKQDGKEIKKEEEKEEESSVEVLE